MEENEIFELPDLVLLEHYGGDFDKFLDTVYSLFKKDFIDTKPIFRGIRLGLKKYPISAGKEATFWHITSEGDDEATREPDLRRMERIKWPAPLINNSEHPYLKVWENKRGDKNNILIFHEQEQFLVVLRKAKDYILPWTAYLVEHNARKKKLLKEYEEYKNAESAQ
ncbi:hypothetical protein LJC38_03655 [Parabacteroides sp. OttesenSCG-928-K15]|nr:hypothetical protein [Parabacteroides sp. OttesenSCG-928-K15]